jgi:hypothetical protein
MKGGWQMDEVIRYRPAILVPSSAYFLVRKVMFDILDLENLDDTERVRRGLRALRFLLAALKADNQRLQAANRQLEDELNHLKGEPGEPKSMVVKVDRTSLPPDAQFKGYEEVLVQDTKIEFEEVLFCQEKFYSPSTGQSYLAQLQPGYTGHFGPGLKALAIVLQGLGRLNQARILRFFEHLGCNLSAAQLSNFLLEYRKTKHKAS